MPVYYESIETVDPRNSGPLQLIWLTISASRFWAEGLGRKTLSLLVIQICVVSLLADLGSRHRGHPQAFVGYVKVDFVVMQPLLKGKGLQYYAPTNGPPQILHPVGFY